MRKLYRYITKTVVLFALLLTQAALGYGAAQPSVWERIKAGEFIVLAEITENPPDPLIPKMTYLGADYFLKGEHGEPVDLEHLKKKCLAIDPPHGIVSIDLEDERVRGLTSWSSNEAEWEAHSQLARQVIAAIREARPDWKLSWFGRVPHFETRHLNGFHANREEGSRGARYREWQNAVRLNRYHREIAGLLDWYHPCLYLQYWDWEYSNGRSTLWFFSTGDPPHYDWVSAIREAQHTPLDVWMDVATVGLRLTRRTYPRKPIIPAISPQWWIRGYIPGDQRPEHGEYVYERWILRQLDLLKVHGDGACIYAHPKAVGETNDQLRASRRWQLVRRWAAQATGE